MKTVLFVCDTDLITVALPSLMRQIITAGGYRYTLDATDSQSFMEQQQHDLTHTVAVFIYLEDNAAAADTAVSSVIDKATGAAIPAVLIGNSASVIDVQQALSLGAKGYATTGSIGDELLPALNAVAVGKVYLPRFLTAVTATSAPHTSTRETAITFKSPANELSFADTAPAATDADTFDDDISLTPRQLNVLELIRHGQSNKQIAYRLRLTEGTVKIHCKAIFRTLGVRNRTEAALQAQKLKCFSYA